MVHRGISTTMLKTCWKEHKFSKVHRKYNTEKCAISHPSWIVTQQLSSHGTPWNVSIPMNFITMHFFPSCPQILSRVNFCPNVNWPYYNFQLGGDVHFSLPSRRRNPWLRKRSCRRNFLLGFALLIEGDGSLDIHTQNFDTTALGITPKSSHLVMQQQISFILEKAIIE